MTIETILTGELIEKYTKSGAWGARIWPDYIDEYSESAPERLAIIDARGTLTYLELRTLIDRLAIGFIGLGVKKEERVGIRLPNWREFIATRFALAKIGAISVPLPIDWREKEVEHVLSVTEAVAIVTPDHFHGRSYVSEHMQMASKLPALRTRVMVGGRTQLPNGWVAFDEISALDRGPKHIPLSCRPNANEVDVIVPTSGSSAAPKLVVRTPNCFLATTKQFTDHRGHFSGSDIVAGLAPVTRGMGYYVGVAAAIVSGATIALLERFSPEEAMRWLQGSRATVAVAVPTQLIKMLQVANFDDYDLSALRMIVNGGAAIPAASAKEVEERFGCVLLSAYGSVEGATPVCTAADDPAEKRYRTVGRVLPGMELKIASDDGGSLPAGSPGEIMYRGPGLSLGFWRDPDSYRKLLDGEGWFATGDLGVLDDQGYLQIVGRKKEIIIRGGINISPAEVEGLLQQCKDVAEVAVVKMPDPVLGERCCAYIVPVSPAKPTVESIARFLEQQGVAKYKFPERVEIRDRLPTTPDGGKVLRRALEEDITALLRNEGTL